MVLLTNQVTQLQTELEEVKQFAKSKMQRMNYDIEDLRSPVTDVVNDLKKENESFMRELDRMDSLYKKVFIEYMDALTENKRIL